MAWTLLLAAGQGNRLASATGGLAKQFLDWKGAPLYWESALVFSRCARVDGLVFVFPEACIDEERERVAGLMRNASLGRLSLAERCVKTPSETAWPLCRVIAWRS